MPNLPRDSSKSPFNLRQMSVNKDRSFSFYLFIFCIAFNLSFSDVRGIFIVFGLSYQEYNILSDLI